MEKATFTAGGRKAFTGWYDPSFKWRGFEVPYFDADTIEEILVWMESDDAPEITEGFFFDGGCWWEVDRDGERHHVPCMMVGDGVTVHAIGCWEWHKSEW
jgi:hypothetical protein